ncbi:MAG: hypothetical protein M1815_002583 [Lichina confinis]|nr:MAG: hypothetical protein M1815_002583 [Lichina confinis]
MDLAKSLIRSVVRAFYETKHILIVDALLVHSALRDDDLAHLLGLQTKELRKLCAKLEEHRLLAVHNRQETREGMQRPISRTYYYIGFRQTIDAIKFRIYRVTKEVESLIRPTDERKDYFCPRCKSRWTQLEVLDYIGPEGFYCHKCDGPLDRDDETIGDRGGHEMQSKLMKQLEPLLVLLPRIDGVVIPDNTFDIAYNARLPVQRNQLINPIATTVPIGSASDGLPTVVKGTQVAVQRIEVDVTSTEEKSAAQQAAEAERKARVAEQNALPVWHTTSTVTGEHTTLGAKEQAAKRERDALIALGVEEDEDKKAAEAEVNDDVAEYYAQLARDQQKAKEAEEASDDEDEEDDDDDDEGEFEDVGTPALGGSSQNATAISSTPATATATAAAGARPNGEISKASSVSSQSQSNGNKAGALKRPGGTSTTNGNDDRSTSSNGSPVKRRRMDDVASSSTGPRAVAAVAAAPASVVSSEKSVLANGTSAKAEQAAPEEDDNDDEEEVEFEDV